MPARIEGDTVSTAYACLCAFVAVFFIALCSTMSVIVVVAAATMEKVIR